MEGTSHQTLITCDPAVMVGKPCVRGTRITVESILEMLASGMTVAEIIGDFPALDQLKIQAALQYAAHHLRKGSAA